MGDQDSKARSARAWAMSRRQHGVLTRAGLLELGFGEKAIKHRIKTGRLHPVTPGVYAVGRRGLSQEGRWMAAVLACGEGSALSHRSAAALWGIGAERGGPVDVTVRRRRRCSRPGISARSRPALVAEDFTECRGIPITTPVRTLIDLATELGERRLERAVNEADKRDLIDPESLRDALDDHGGEPGVRALRALLDRHTFRLSDEDLELLFRPIAASAGLPTPETKHRQRVRGRFPLARAGPRGRDRRLPLSPHSGHSVPRRAPRPDPHRGRADPASLLPLPGEVRTGPRPPSPDRDGHSPWSLSALGRLGLAKAVEAPPVSSASEIRQVVSRSLRPPGRARRACAREVRSRRWRRSFRRSARVGSGGRGSRA
jgi:hypothetical protein